MQSLRKIGAVSAIVLGMVGSAHAQDVDADTVVATINGTEITVGHLIAARTSLPEQYLSLEDNVLYEGLVDQLIQQTALSQSLGDTLSKRAKLGIENQISGFSAGEALNLAADAVLTEEALAAAYEAQYAGADPEREFNASHILVATEEEAKAIKVDLDGGADFAATAVEKSTGPSGPGGGELGWFGAGMMVPEFETAVIALEDGEVSEPVQTQFGWHLVKRNDSRIKSAPPLDEVRGDLEQRLRADAIEAAITAATDAATVEMMEVTIDPSIIRNTDLLKD
jgi:peptidyl-prolyl cis-trans isomerase C